MTGVCSRGRLLALLSFAAVLAVYGCRGEESATIDLADRGILPGAVVKPEAVRIAIAGMIIPREGFAYYQEFLDYLGEKGGRPLNAVYMENYADTNRLLATGVVDVGFVCSGPYVDGHAEFGLEILVVPQVNGVPAYYSYVIVPTASTARNFEELRGKTFAFTDPASNTGKVYPTYLLAGMKETPEGFFRRFIYTTSHDKSITAVADGVVDGAAVDSLIWDYLARTNPSLTKRTRIILKSPPFGIPPVTVRKGVDPAVVEVLKKAFLDAHTDPRGKAILDKMMIERFIPGDDSLYDSVREMKAWIDKASGE